MHRKHFSLSACLLLLSAIYSCTHSKGAFREVNDHGLTIQLIKTPNNSDVTGDISYSARLIPDKGVIAENDNTVKTNLSYRMDSCFYLQTGKKKIYASLTQPIANGVSGSFEYLLSFENVEVNDGKWNLVYQDKYLNHQKYTLSLNND